MNKKFLFFIIIIVPLIIVISLRFSTFLNQFKKDETVNNIETNTKTEKTENYFKNNNTKVFESEEPTFHPAEKNVINPPINNALKRVTKKPFGIKVSSDNSPVQPERFSGYHTGVDFETFTEEENLEIDIFAICTGPLILKKRVSGYGGVAIQQCEINNEIVSIVYGHLKLVSISKNLNENIVQGEKIGILGQGFSSETDGERKHLHLGIHRGEEVNLAGYVQSQEKLSDWIDYESLIKN